MAAVNVVFDGPRSHESGRFVEVEDDGGRSVKVGEWHGRANGWWGLRITDEDLADFLVRNAVLREAEAFPGINRTS
jgi:hypothetical protein